MIQITAHVAVTAIHSPRWESADMKHLSAIDPLMILHSISIQPATVSMRAITGLLTPIGHTQITKNRRGLYSMAGTHKAIVQ